MSLFDIIAILITLAAVFSYLNYKLFRLPTTIGLMILSLLLSLTLVILGRQYSQLDQMAHELINSIDFNQTLMQGMLGFLLFAGALHVNINDLNKQKVVIGVLATAGIVINTFITGTLTWWALKLINLPMDYQHCLIFGALISPTDPIAVLGILKSLGAPKTLETKITGESLFNDGVGVVVFLALLGVAGLSGGDASGGHGDTTASQIAILFAQEAIGGAAWGMLLGSVCYILLRSVDNYQVEILLSLAMVMGGYAAAGLMHVSGPIAMVIAGLFIGNHGRSFAMSDNTRHHLDMFWELVDEILNAVLFVLIGLEVLVLTLDAKYILAGLIAIVITLLARFIAVGIPILCMKPLRQFTPHAIKVLTWSGLRGGISVALALSLRNTMGHTAPQSYQAILMMTYIIVIFSIIGQGLTLGPLLRKLGLSTR
ncbi:sodium:proton antiporter [bacterium AH-315-I18]|nr:sodium:proton antiporter [Phycisphaeraceae bacterium]MBN4060805.1 sodium:proton antiporter [bacterium AH-315-I18]